MFMRNCFFKNNSKVVKGPTSECVACKMLMLIFIIKKKSYNLLVQLFYRLQTLSCDARKLTY